MADGVLVGKGAGPLVLDLALANRHGLIAGATGTGKTVTLQVLAEGFSERGVPVFCADVKGDLAGLSQPGTPSAKLEERTAATGVDGFSYRGSPVLFWDVFGEQGHPVRATVSEMGPVLLSRMLELNETQEGVLTIAFRLADDEGLLLLDLKDLRAVLGYVAERAGELAVQYGNVTKATIGTIQRRLLMLEQAGATGFFGEPALALSDLMMVTPQGRGAISVLAADKLIRSPLLYATVLLWLLSELFEELPEVGDLARPKLVFFFDEAHLLFTGAPRALVAKVEQVVRLIRSKGVGVYFVTQNPVDVPPSVLGQLGNRVQHALRAYSPADQKAVRVAAETFRANPGFSTEAAITTLEVGEALVSLLGARGVPGVVERALIRPPSSRIGVVTAEERRASVAGSPVAGKYEAAVDRESAFERLSGRANGSFASAPAGGAAAARVDASDPWGGMGRAARPAAPGRSVWNQGPAMGALSPGYAPSPAATPGLGAPAEGGSALGEMLSHLVLGTGRREGVAEALAKSMARSVGGGLGRSIWRGVLGSVIK